MPLSRTAMFASPLGQAVALLSMTGRETMGRPFSFEVDLLSESDSLDLKKVLAQPASVILERLNGTLREFNGLVTEFGLVGEHGNFARYRCTLRPALWFIGQNRKCRIFQNLTVPEIVLELLRQRGITDFENLITDTHRKWEFLVQYRESDLNFINRILEQEGIYYFFKHQGGKHILVLLDSSAKHEPAEGFAEVPFYAPLERGLRLEEHLDSWFTKREIRPDKVTLGDFNFESPLPFTTEKAVLALDNKRDDKHDDKHDDAEVYDYPAEAVDIDEAEVQAKRRLEELHADHEIATGAGPVRGLYTGAKFKLTQFPRDDQNKDYVIIGASYEISTAQFESNQVDSDHPNFRCAFRAIDAKQQYRSPSITKKPIVEGPQTATVVGPEGKEIFTDEYGRVKLKFHWDRDPKKDASSSCFVRVSQAWAGEDWGSTHIPRIHQEVIVSFLEGDPDRPIVTGRVYNGFNHAPYPDNPTQSGIKSRSTPGGSPDNFNEIRFEDKKGAEELHMQAEKDMSTLVKHDRTTTILRNDTLNITGDQFIKIHGNLSMTVEGVTEKNNPDKTKPVKSSLGVTGAHRIDASDTIDIQAPNKITLTCGDSVITMVPGRITLTTAGSTVAIDPNIFLHSSKDAQMMLDPNAFIKASGGGNMLLSGDAVVQSAGKSQMSLTGDANLTSDGAIGLSGATLSGKGKTEAGLDGGGSTIALNAASADLAGAQVNVTGKGVVSIGGPLVKIG